MRTYKFILAISLLASFSSGAYADKIGSDSLIYRDNGELHTMTHWQASGVNPKTLRPTGQGDACAPFGGHLPKIRELAERVLENGAIRGALREAVVPGYTLFKTKDLDGKPDNFYEKNSAQQKSFIDAPALWSASLSSDDSQIAFTLVNIRSEDNAKSVYNIGQVTRDANMARRLVRAWKKSLSY